LVRRFAWLKAHIRLFVQVAFTAATNGYLIGFLKGKIYQGKLKAVCVPGLNCYSCPGALGSCPIGSLQAVLGSRDYQFAFYVFGFMMVVGSLTGRLTCGWLCPFGLFQDLLYKIPFVKKLRSLPGERILQALRYVILVLFVIVLPMFAVNLIGEGQPWFCKYICPSGTLIGGIPLALLNQGVRDALGALFTWKIGILIAIVLLSVLLYRPFCRYLCPLGAIYGLFNPVSVYQYRVDAKKCISCGACQKQCGLNIPVYRTPNSTACIRCGKCRSVCPTGAIYTTCSGAKRSERPSQKR